MGATAVVSLDTVVLMWILLWLKLGTSGTVYYNQTYLTLLVIHCCSLLLSHWLLWSSGYCGLLMLFRLSEATAVVFCWVTCIYEWCYSALQRTMVAHQTGTLQSMRTAYPLQLADATDFLLLSWVLSDATVVSFGCPMMFPKSMQYTRQILNSQSPQSSHHCCCPVPLSTMLPCYCCLVLLLCCWVSYGYSAQ